MVENSLSDHQLKRKMAPNNDETTGGLLQVKKIFDMAKDILNSSTPVESDVMDNTKEETREDEDGTGPSSFLGGGDGADKAENESTDKTNNGRKPRMTRSSTNHLRKSSLMVDMMTGLMLDDDFDEA